MPPRLDLTGFDVDGIVALRPSDKRECGSLVWVWKCVCGNEFEARHTFIKNKHVRSCGCLKRRNADKKKLCRHCGELSYRRNQNGCYSTVCNKCWNKQCNASKLEHPKKITLNAAKQRARRENLPFSIDENDIVVPDVCPILGIDLVWEPGSGRSDNSPSLDKIIPELGYVPGNVAVISFRANRIKNNGTFNEHRLIADWMEAQLTKGVIA